VFIQFLAWWPEREKRVLAMIVELLAKATRRLVQREIRRAQGTEQAVPYR
jgi:hypothetical protein